MSSLVSAPLSAPPPCIFPGPDPVWDGDEEAARAAQEAGDRLTLTKPGRALCIRCGGRYLWRRPDALRKHRERAGCWLAPVLRGLEARGLTPCGNAWRTIASAGFEVVWEPGTVIPLYARRRKVQLSPPVFVALTFEEESSGSGPATCCPYPVQCEGLVQPWREFALARITSDSKANDIRFDAPARLFWGDARANRACELLSQSGATSKLRPLGVKLLVEDAEVMAAALSAAALAHNDSSYARGQAAWVTVAAELKVRGLVTGKLRRAARSSSRGAG